LRPRTTQSARIGFNAGVYAVSFFMVWMILSFFATDGMEATGKIRAMWGLVMSLAIFVGYLFKVGRAAWISSASAWRVVWASGVGTWSCWSRASSRRCIRHRIACDHSSCHPYHGNADVHHCQRAALCPHTVGGTYSTGYYGMDAGRRFHLVHLPDCGEHSAADLGGQFMEPSGLLVIVAPVVFPIAMELGVDPIHLGIIMVVNMEIGMITPPIGLEPVRDFGYHQHEPGDSGQGGDALCWRLDDLPGHRHLCAVDLDGPAVCTDGTGAGNQVGKQHLWAESLNHGFTTRTSPERSILPPLTSWRPAAAFFRYHGHARLRPDFFPLDENGPQQAVAMYHCRGERPSRRFPAEEGDRRPWLPLAGYPLWRSLETRFPLRTDFAGFACCSQAPRGLSR
jgi:hypothetical protein